MRRCIPFSVLPLMGLCWFCLTESRADDATLNPPATASEAPASQPPTQVAAEKEPAVPRFVLLLTRQVATDHAPVDRTASPDYGDDFAPTQVIPKRLVSPAKSEPRRSSKHPATRSKKNEDEYYIEAVPEPGISSYKPEPKRSSKRPVKPSSSQETLRVLCADVKLSGSAAPEKAVSYTVQCTGPVTLENGTTKIHASNLHYAEGALTLDDVTIQQTGSTAGLFEEMQSKQLIIKFPLESLAIQDADKYIAPKPRDDQRRAPDEFDDFDDFSDPKA
ncbi:hypothetical protein Mal52_21200 [Symmachiella dynata]|uniref:Uncharacterized protein n=1 Tax=Symmachiella dynata TaxID=2527995 RepID=A0A517ZMD8_9PLAN|nr:hypothetical protein [Symmachiella dynata]QDU43644.1 hypothetical protein Mal52_21200 [Symmachiella dynata]